MGSIIFNPNSEQRSLWVNSKSEQRLLGVASTCSFIIVQSGRTITVRYLAVTPTTLEVARRYTGGGGGGGGFSNTVALKCYNDMKLNSEQTLATP